MLPIWWPQLDHFEDYFSGVFSCILPELLDYSLSDFIVPIRVAPDYNPLDIVNVSHLSYSSTLHLSSERALRRYGYRGLLFRNRASRYTRAQLKASRAVHSKVSSDLARSR